MLVNVGCFTALATRFSPRSNTEAGRLTDVRRSTACLSASGPSAHLEAGARLSASHLRLSLRGSTRSSMASEHLDALLS